MMHGPVINPKTFIDAKPRTHQKSNLSKLHPAIMKRLVPLSNWVNWKWELNENGDAWTKVPYRPKNPSHKAAINKKSTWGTHAEAVKNVKAGLADGIGFCLLNTNIVAFDVDDCRDLVTGKLDPVATSLINRCNSYVEETVSGTGLRIIGLGGTKNTNRKQKVLGSRVSIESYRNCPRYITVSGMTLSGVKPRTADLVNLNTMIDTVVKELSAQTSSAPPQNDDAPQRVNKRDVSNSELDNKNLNYIEMGLPDSLIKLIRDGAPEGERSDQFNHAVKWLKDKNVKIETIIKLLLKYPDGIAAKYNAKKRVGVEAYRVYDKPDNPKPQNADHKKDKPNGAALIYFDEAVASDESKRWIIKGVIAEGETSSWIGPPKSGKSGVFTDICISAANGKNWRGYRTKRKTGVVYFALERGDLVARRLRAYAQRDKLKTLPIAIKKGVIDLLDPKCIDYFVDAIKEAAAHFGSDVGLIVIDTFSKGIADGGGDENQAKDQNRALANLRRVQEQSGVHVAIIHHTGKDEARGARGSNAHLGDVDAMIQISGKKNIKIATVTDANDQATGVLTKFEMEVIKLGVDEDGDAIITAIVSNNDIVDVKDEQVSKLSTQVQLAFNLLLQIFFDGRGRPPPSDTTRKKYPKETKVCTLDEWKEDCQRGGLTSSDDHKAFYKAFERAHQILLAKRMIGELDKNIWVVGAVEPTKKR
jgi:AAA domain